ncbi:hypothetical protein BDZ97DRAFT_1927208 [Flammula alnicola]|nr:hypothetical protein BDZ97DRAFT_1927208 [Flammula alnicola]
MTVLVDHVHYIDLPSLVDVHISLQAPFIENVINGPIWDVFLKHTTHLTFYLYFQHCHHAVSANEAIVKVEGTAHLINGQVLKDIASFRNKVIPTTWMTSRGQVILMEFTVVCAAYVVLSIVSSGSPYLILLLLGPPLQPPH